MRHKGWPVYSESNVGYYIAQLLMLDRFVES